MKGTDSGIVLVVIFLLLGVTVNAEQHVQVDGTTVKLICPAGADGSGVDSWHHEGKQLDAPPGSKTFNITDYTESNDGKYECKQKAGSHWFYLRIKICEGCIDLNTETMIGIICGDLLVTILVAGSVYGFAKRRGAASKDFRHQKFEPDGIPSSRGSNMTSAHQQSDYAPIKSGQRAVYDKLQRKV
ncbi:T-cell surface glycoprotein CD3 epsilon chain-like isoform X1 [Heterodontus francisci]|uniref:T-cell surface glycoprotein CD3 epsilon chain-like isoform X1 n=1 Tax=Heterodontus francisci TaxID=7792 RepID=UPI00355B7BB0